MHSASLVGEHGVLSARTQCCELGWKGQGSSPPAGEVDWGGDEHNLQGRQLAAPATAEKVPAGHSWQASHGALGSDALR
jgi:hypothetical protein